MSNLNNEKIQVINPEYKTQKKSMLVAYLLVIFLGTLGLHRIYLGKSISGILQLLLTAIGSVTLLFLVGVIPLLIVALWVFVDLFLTYFMVSKYNNNLQSCSIKRILAQKNVTQF